MFAYIQERAAHKRQMGKISSSDVYLATAVHFRRFLAGRRCRLSDLTATLVADFRCFLQAEGLKVNTINSYLSSLRAVYHAACHDGRVSLRRDPFLNLKLRRETTAKRAVPAALMQRVASFSTSVLRPEQELAVDLATFSFLACGMPFVDMAYLTRHNIRGKELVYNRRKTGVQIRMEITAGMWQIIRKYASSAASRPYLFPILPSGSSSHAQYKYRLAVFNRHLKDLGVRLHFPTELTSYVIRHSWASAALRCHVPVAVISQALGHTSEKTTRCYLSELDVSELTKANRKVAGSVDRLVREKWKRKSTYL